MGNGQSFEERLLGRQPTAVLLFGLSEAGKSTILHQQTRDAAVSHATTTDQLERKVAYFAVNGMPFKVLNGGGKMENVCLCRLHGDAIVFVVDSSSLEDKEKTQHMKTQLSLLLSEPDLEGRPLLLFCNKQDVHGARSPLQVMQHLDLFQKMGNRPWKAVGCVATQGTGLKEGFRWIERTLSHHRPGSSRPLTSTIILAPNRTLAKYFGSHNQPQSKRESLKLESNPATLTGLECKARDGSGLATPAILTMEDEIDPSCDGQTDESSCQTQSSAASAHHQPLDESTTEDHLSTAEGLWEENGSVVDIDMSCIGDPSMLYVSSDMQEDTEDDWEMVS